MVNVDSSCSNIKLIVPIAELIIFWLLKSILKCAKSSTNWNFRFTYCSNSFTICWIFCCITLLPLKNFTLNDNIEVIPISISDNYLKVFCDGYLMEIGILDEDSTLYIMSKYKPENNPVRMPLTEIIKKLNNNGI